MMTEPACLFIYHAVSDALDMDCVTHARKRAIYEEDRNVRVNTVDIPKEANCGILPPTDEVSSQERGSDVESEEIFVAQISSRLSKFHVRIVKNRIIKDPEFQKCKNALEDRGLSLGTAKGYVALVDPHHWPDHVVMTNAYKYMWCDGC